MNRQDDFEMQLRQAMGREQAPSDFAAKVLARAKTQKVVEISWWSRPVALAVAALLVLGIAIPAALRLEEYRKAEHARQQLILAMQITKSKLDSTRLKLQRKHHDQ